MKRTGDTKTLFGIEWTGTVVNNRLSLVECTHPSFGTFYMTGFFNDEWRDGGDNDYKMASLIYETHLAKRKLLLITDDKVREELEKLGGYDVVTSNQLLRRFPRTIEEKQIRILQNMYRLQPTPGSVVGDFQFEPALNFSTNKPELGFLLEIMTNKRLIDVGIQWVSGHRDFGPRLPLIISETGWRHLEELDKSASSQQVFVAMWFDDSMAAVFHAMEAAIEDLDAGLSAFRIDNKEHNNEISGEILYEIRRSKLLIADVTEHRQGVYFEAGYAIGLGIPVIWCCRDTDLEKVHFDTRQYNHVVWKDEADLRVKLSSRMKGTIL